MVPIMTSLHANSTLKAYFFRISLVTL
jgi:hypothetical protein